MGRRNHRDKSIDFIKSMWSWACTFLLLLCFSTTMYAQVLEEKSIAKNLTLRHFDEVIKRGKERLKSKNLSSKDSAELFYQVSLAYYQTGQANLAKTSIEKAYSISQSLAVRSPNDLQLKIEISNSYVYHLINDFEYQKGLKIVNQNLVTIKKSNGEYPELRMQTYLRKIALLRMSSAIDSALSYVRLAQSLLAKIPPEKIPNFHLQLLSEEAASYSDNHEISKAIPLYKKIITIAEGDQNRDQLAVFYNNLGIAYMRIGDYGSSKSSLLKSLSHYPDSKDQYNPSLESCLNNLALTNIYLERYTEAESYYSQVLQLVEGAYGTDHIRLGYTYKNLGICSFYQESFDQAIYYFEKALILFEKHLRYPHDETADVKRLLGTSLLRVNENEQGQSLLMEALKDWKSLNRKVHEGRTIALSELALYHYERNEKDISNRYLRKGFESVSYDPESPLHFEQVTYPLGLSQLIHLQVRQRIDEWKASSLGNPSSTLEYLFEVCDSLRNFLTYRYDHKSTRRQIYSKMKWMPEYWLEYQFHLNDESHDANAVFNKLERSNNTFLFEKKMEDNITEWLEMPLDIIELKNKLKDSLASLNMNIIGYDNSKANPKYKKKLIEYNTTRDRLNNLYKVIRSRYPLYYETLYNPVITNLTEVQKSLPDHACILHFYLGEKDAYLFKISNKQTKLSYLGPVATITKKVNKLNNLLQKKGNESELQALCEDLRHLLLIDVDLSDISNMTILPHGILVSLPLEILREEGKNINSKVKINYSYAHSIHSPSGNTKTKNNTLFMAPVFDHYDSTLIAANHLTRTFNTHLPATQSEVKHLASLFGDQPYLTQEATKANFKSKAPGANLIHLATHAVMDMENPDLSYIQFFNKATEQESKLYAGEIANMTLQADLVTLSACNTGLGKWQQGEGAQSLGRAFAYAGATNQVISLWPVNDVSTEKIMRFFYENLKEGMNKGDALARAKQQYLDTAPKALQHPYYWAGFVYYGNNSPIPWSKNKKNAKYLLLLPLVFLAGLWLYKIKQQRL